MIRANATATTDDGRTQALPVAGVAFVFVGVESFIIGNATLGQGPAFRYGPKGVAIGADGPVGQV